MQELRRAGGRGLGLTDGGPAFLLGFLAAAFQIYLLREFAAHFYGNELTFGLVLGAWLLWGGLGSLAGPLPAAPGHAAGDHQRSLEPGRRSPAKRAP